MNRMTGSDPIATELLVPARDDGAEPEISIVVPALNEQITIGEFVDWCHEGLRQAGVRGEIIIVDSSSDDTPALALAHGARVLRTPKRGLGHAYLDAIPYIRGKFVVMGDCDLTYDFRNLAPFVQAYRTGAEFVMGSRFRGTIEAGAMPALHRYFGTPLTTWILNFIYRSRYTDIHCGMRGLTLDALKRIELTSTGWEYASEMVLKASRLQLRIAEVPVTFYKDREGRLSHHRRAGFWSPWAAGWINLKVMLVFSPDSFLLKPGLLLLAIGFVLSVLPVFGPVVFLGVGFSLYWQILGVTCATLGYGCIQVGVLARTIHRLRSGGFAGSIQQVLLYNRGMIVSATSVALGILLALPLVGRYVGGGFRLTEGSPWAILGLLFVILGFQTFGFTLILEMLRRVRQPARLDR